MSVIIPAIYALLFVIPLWAIARIALRLLDRRTRESIRCRKCWYDLRGNKSNKCPECGSEIRKVGAWWPGYPKHGQRANYLMTWMALCAIIAAYIGGYYKKSSHDIDGGLLIHARVDGHENRLLIGAMAYVDGYSLKMPLIPTGSYQAYNVTYHVSLDRERQYAIFAEGSPLAVGFDTPRTLTPGTPVSLCIFENTAEAVINEPLAQEYKDAMRLVVTSMERLLSKKRFYPDLSAAEQTVDEVYREIGSPESISIKVDSHTQTLWSTHGPEWVRYIPAIPILAVWLIGAIFISRNLSRSGVVWTIPSAANDA